MANKPAEDIYYADQHIAVDLDEGVKANYAKSVSCWPR